MITDIDFYRAQAVEAERQAGSAMSDTALARCQGFAAWWSAIGDALEAGDMDRATELTGKVTSLRG